MNHLFSRERGQREEHGHPADGEHADDQTTSDPDAHRARLLARAREILNRPEPIERDPNVVARAAEYERDALRRKEQEQRTAERRVASPAPVEAAISLDGHGSAHHVERFTDVTMQRARELCEAAWTAPYKSRSNTGFANKHGNCEGKALWLQKHLGGVVMTGFKGAGRHAVLLLPIEGQLHVLDGGEVTSVEEYPFFVEGFYEKG